MRHFFIQLFFFVTLIPSIAQEYNIELEIKGAENLDAQFAYYESDKQFVVQKGKFDEKGKLIFKDKRKLLSDLSKYFPHGINEVVINGKLPKENLEIPTMDLDGKKIIDSIKLADVLIKEDARALFT